MNQRYFSLTYPSRDNSSAPVQKLFRFDDFWRENMRSDGKYSHIDLSCRTTENGQEYMIQFWDSEGEFICSFKHHILPVVCEQALKYKEENEM